ncbi:hypothetical protein ACJMK2_017277 [Sinanodonta woodiana]|uniref:RING-type domain-containing protein n=1 Tax=Sinanodonta woodiana TaxID=1069815 RepID=A0ABD3UZ16_SINWO
MAEAQVENEPRNLTCPICLETLESPKVLTCLHTFCEKCICKHVRGESVEWTQADQRKCPLCRTPIPAPTAQQTPEDWAAKLPTIPVIQASMEMDQTGKDTVVNCQPCLTDGKRNICVAFCVTCSEYLCQVCYDCHKKFKMSKDHTITISSMPDNSVLPETKDEVFRCTRHMKKYTYVCLQHKDLCCSKCAVTDHKYCKDLFLIENVANGCKENSEMKKVLENLDGLRNMFITLLENRSQNFDSIQQQESSIILEIKEWTKAVKELTDKLEMATLEKLEQVYKEDALTISDQIIECKSVIAAIETSKNMLLEETKSDSDDTKTFMVLTRVSQQVKRYIQKHDVAQNSFKNVQILFEPDKNLGRMIEPLSSLGQIIRKACQLQGLSSDRSYEKSKMLLPCLQPDSMITFNSKLPDDKRTCSIYSGIFLPDDRLVLSDQRNRKLKMFDKCFHCVSYLRITEEPRFMCNVNPETLAVTSSGQRVHIVSVANQITKLNTLTVEGDCFGIASSPQNIIIEKVLQGQYLLDIYDMSYHLIKTIQRPNQTNSFYNTLSVSPNGKGIYCTGGNTICTIDINGELMNTFQSNDLTEALGITVDKNGILYCCGCRSKTVIQVTSSSRQLGVLLSSDHGLKSPVGVSLNTKNNKIIVFESKSDEIKVFRLI